MHHKDNHMRRLSSIFFVLALVTLSINNVYGCKRSYVPRGGLSQPAGGSADDWQSGYMASFDVVPSIKGRFGWGGRIGFHRWTPNAEEMLQTNNRKFVVEKAHGWRTALELSAIANYRLIFLPYRLGSIWADGGVGVFYVKSSDIDVKGVHPDGTSALIRHIYQESDSEMVPGISAGVSMVIIGRIEPNIRYQHIFAPDKEMGILTLGIGLLPF